MATDMQLHTVASLLRRGHSLDLLSTGLALLGALLGLGQFLLGVAAPWAIGLSVALLVLGVLQKYWALRVAFDAELFQRVADSPLPLTERGAELDQALSALGLQPAHAGGRPWPQRSRGALGLLRRQAWLLAAQVLLTLGFILASPWLVVAG
ncbi:hypothetical protein [Pseudomonas sp. NFIX28]|jgi:hypothetical protein|uniref:hypothetical protein n=1 Tax=Pseudomonas sp. NFIX28 TaxID=1566235 RepID=UPI00089CF5F2|nr:hypothetical protein [Pseudomonas sp. NFIX28]SDY59159.1 hypothetical protein SAMN03159453_00862 [Pseudomonas sp. NFIX28]